MDSINFAPDLPPAIINQSARSRHIRVRLPGDGTIRVSAPRRLPAVLIRRFLSAKAGWIRRHYTAQNETYEFLLGSKLTDGILIKTEAAVLLSASGRNGVLKLSYPSQGVNLNQLYAEAKPHINKLLTHEARQLLTPRVELIAEGHGLSYSNLRFRFMSTRWGSCTGAGSVTLNSQLIRLPAELQKYVIVHELVHTVHHHHQPSFWQAVGTIDPDFKQKRQELRSHKLWR